MTSITALAMGKMNCAMDEDLGMFNTFLHVSNVNQKLKLLVHATIVLMLLPQLPR